jgi:ABC-2 type transport system permease protein
MSSESPVESQRIAPGPVPGTRPMYWSVWREIWENRSVYIAPLVVSGVVFFASCVSTLTLPHRLKSATDAAKQQHSIIATYSVAPSAIMFTTLIVAVFFCLDALYGERRDRSILFWKSLPVSDRTTVLAKAFIPFVVLPLAAFLLSIVTQRILIVLGSGILMANGMSPERLHADLPLFQEAIVMFYGLTVHVLWFAPIYGWLFLVSAWARRTPILWAFLPPFAIALIEWILFNTAFFASMLRYRVMGAMSEAFVVQKKGEAIIRLSQLDPARFLAAPGLWVGLLFAAACLFGAIRLRRLREPI